MFNLKDILKNVGKEEKAERRTALVGIAEEQLKWSLDDKTNVITSINLTKYQLYWLMWRIRVHLKSYEHFEWSEMKDVLQSILVVLEGEWAKCQSSSVQHVVESTANSKDQTVDSVSTIPGHLLTSPSL